MTLERTLAEKADFLARYFEAVSAPVWSSADAELNVLHNLQSLTYNAHKVEGYTAAHETSLRAVLRYVLLGDPQPNDSPAL